MIDQEQMGTRKMVFGVAVAVAVILLAIILGATFSKKVSHSNSELDKSYELLD